MATAQEEVTVERYIDHGMLENKNNHSLVTRVDFGQSSFLFTGDLEDTPIERLVDRYRNTATLDVDVYEVWHHGSHNGTTEELLDAMTPKIAVISVGQWDDGKLKKATKKKTGTLPERPGGCYAQKVPGPFFHSAGITSLACPGQVQVRTQNRVGPAVAWRCRRVCA